MPANESASALKNQVVSWLNNVVIGLNLCPFAAYPQSRQQVRVCIYEGRPDAELLQTISDELKLLDCSKPGDCNYVETTLICCRNSLAEFLEFNDFLGLCNELLSQEGWQGQYQLASFHPKYQFAETDAEDRENLTNRAPCPIFHLIREDSLSQALEHYQGEPEQIFEDNINCVQNLSESRVKQLFPWISKN